VRIPENPDKTIIKAAEAKNTPKEAMYTIILIALLLLPEKRYLLEKKRTGFKIINL
jgi:hypothetical protein